MIYQNIAIGNGRFCKSCNHWYHHTQQFKPSYWT
jgi:hypothetical protein